MNRRGRFFEGWRCINDLAESKANRNYGVQHSNTERETSDWLCLLMQKWHWRFQPSVVALPVFAPHNWKRSCVYADFSTIITASPAATHISLSAYSLSSEYHTLEPSIHRVLHHNGQQDAADDGPSSAVTTVTRELLQEAAEHIRAALWETLGGEGGTGSPLRGK